MTEDDLIREQLKTVPYPLLASELARRNSERRRVKAGPPEKLEPCKHCGRILTARQRRRACPAH